MTHLLIISNHPAFAESFAAIVSRELGWRVAVSKAWSASLQADLVVAHEEILPPPACPMVLVGQGKPHKVQALLAQCRQALQAPNRIMLFEEIELLVREKRLISKGKEVDLTDKEQSLVLYLYEKKITTRAELLQNIWGMAENSDTHTLETHMYRLRQKWREISEKECIIATPQGYQWNE